MLAAFRLETPVPSPMKMMTFLARVVWAKDETDRVRANINIVSLE
jgi:hypothetical protein